MINLTAQATAQDKTVNRSAFYCLCSILYSIKLLRDKTFGGFGTARKLTEKILVADHTNNSSLLALTTFGR